MKKIISVNLAVAIIFTSSIMIYAKPSDTKDNTEVKSENVITTQTEIKDDKSNTLEKKPELTAEEVNAKLEQEATKLGITVEELKAKILEKKAENLDKKDSTKGKKENINSNPKLAELKAAFKAIKKDHAAKKALLEAIAKAKQEAKDEKIDVFLKGDSIDFDVPPIVKSGRTLIPIRAIMGKFGAEVAWDEATSTVTLTKEDTIIKLVIGSDVALVNGIEVKLDVPAEINDNRTLVPIRFIAETLKQNVEYDDSSKTIIIDDTTTTEDTTTATEPIPTTIDPETTVTTPTTAVTED